MVKILSSILGLIGIFLILIGVDIALFIAGNFVIAIILLVTTFFIIKFIYKLGFDALTGDFYNNIDLSLLKIEKVEIETKDGGKIYGQIYRDNRNHEKINNKKPYVIGTHGAHDNYQKIEWFSVPIVFTGINVISYNQSGCGNDNEISTGDWRNYVEGIGNIHDVVEYVLKLPDLLFKDGTPQIGFIGHSTGGLIALTQAYLNPNIQITIAMSGIHDYMQASTGNYPLFSTMWFFKLSLKIGGMKIDYTDDENHYISPKFCLKPNLENENRVYMIHTADDPLPLDDMIKNKEIAGISDSNCLFLSKGGHGFRTQETLVVGQIVSWINEKFN